MHERREIETVWIGEIEVDTSDGDPTRNYSTEGREIREDLTTVFRDRKHTHTFHRPVLAGEN